MRGATHALIAILDSNIYFNPRTPRGVRPDYEGVNFWQSIISIHAPRAGATVYKIILHTFATKGNF